MKLAAPETASTQLWNHECWLLSSAAEGWAVENVSQVNLSTDEMELVWCVSLKQPLVLQGVWFYISLQFSHSLWVCVQALFRPSQPPPKKQGMIFPHLFCSASSFLAAHVEVQGNSSCLCLIFLFHSLPRTLSFALDDGMLCLSSPNTLRYVSVHGDHPLVFTLISLATLWGFLGK